MKPINKYKLKLKIIKTLKFTQTTNLLKLNNKTYIPFQLHQLPKKYEEFPLNTIIKLKGYIYICTSNFKNSKKMIDNITHNKQLTYKNSI